MERSDQPAPDGVTLRWDGDDGDGIGRLTVSASANGFAGRSSAWFDREAVVAFGQALGAYPLPDEVIMISGGFGAKNDNPPQEHVGIGVSPVGALGQVGVRVHLATAVWEPSDNESRHDVSLRLLTTYEHLRRFSEQLVRLVAGDLEEAEICGDTSHLS